MFSPVEKFMLASMHAIEPKSMAISGKSKSEVIAGIISTARLMLDLTDELTSRDEQILTGMINVLEEVSS